MLLVCLGMVFGEEMQAAESANEYFANILQRAEAGEKESQKRAADMYRYGMGVERDIDEANRWSQLAETIAADDDELVDSSESNDDAGESVQETGSALEENSDASVLVGASAEEQRESDIDDPMQQVINYLVTGNPLVRRRTHAFGLGSVEAFILSRKQCVMGLAMKNVLASDTIEMWFNNADLDSIEFESRYVNADVAALQALEEGYNTYIKLSGYPVAITSSSGLKLTSESVLLGNIDVNRAKEALNLLYRDHCKGAESETAF